MKLSFLLVLATACGSVHANADANVAKDASVDAHHVDAHPDGPPDAAAMATFTKTGAWGCLGQVNCDEIYDFDLGAGTQITANVTLVTEASVPRLGVFLGAATTGTNLFNNAAGAVCGTQDTNLTAGPITLAAAGHYRVTVGRDYEKSAGSAGTFTITIMTAPGGTSDGQTGTDVTSNQANCP